ncbi:hypothetical protein SLEP1_g38132 [Rubroshorea leprosula]|uniref:Uncharacterized protein n=1 Tax=Rubroshorea leprosula TaxID=152421 RepID=A0AAV5KXT6_9ROSI|nr:hypothetical protein SLEP1_g38132 [Rubroshorea leprosula]
MEKFYRTDLETIVSEIKHQEKQLRLKRRWLIGLPTSPSQSKRKQFKAPKFLKHECLPESFLREDDIFYETIKSHVEEAFGACNFGRGSWAFQDNIQSFDAPNVMQVLVSCLDALTNNGLYLIAMILTGGSVMFDHTRCKMKKVIRESLSNYVGSQNQDHRLGEINRQLSQVLSNPQNFRENGLKCCALTSLSRYAAAAKVLDGLEDLPTYSLIAMHRKLRSVQRLPHLQPHKLGKSRHRLINQIRRTGKRMLMELGKWDELQEPLAKALVVADLSLKLTTGCQNSSIANIHQIPPEIRRLQNEIVKAIWSLKMVRIPGLKTLKHLLDPNAEISNGCLRTAIKKMLIEYLFECIDMDTIPKSLLEALAIINKGSRTITPRFFPKEEIEEEVECILRVSAQTKQAIWDLLPDHELDNQFADAYMEELEESDDDNGWQVEITKSDSCMSHFVGSDCHLEGTDESKPVLSKAPTPPNTMEGLEPEHFARVDRFCMTHGDNTVPPLKSPCGGLNDYSVNDDDLKHDRAVDPETPSILSSSNFVHRETKFIPKKQSTCRNQYLSIQEVCDQASVVAYNLIGQLLEKLAEDQSIELDQSYSLYLRGDLSCQEGSQEEEQTSSEKNGGGSLIVQAAEELMPCLSKSVIEKLKKFMGVM